MPDEPPLKGESSSSSSKVESSKKTESPAVATTTMKDSSASTTSANTTSKTVSKPASSASSVHSNSASAASSAPVRRGSKDASSTLQVPGASGSSATPAPSKKQSMTERISRMFSSSAVNEHKDGSGSDSDGSGGHGAKKKSPVEPVRRPSRRESVSKDKKRFEILPDGGHSHHLRSTKRQEKLSDMLRDLIIGKKKDPVEPDRLSLVANWADQLKNEKDKVATDKKTTPNSSGTLVEKYGKCHEVIGRGAFGIVRISHKVDPKNGHQEQLYAVKEFRRRPQESSRRYQKRLTSEFCISSSLRHPNVIQTLDLLQDAKGDYCEVMEFCAGGDLYTLVLAAGKLDVTEADCFFKQLMRGVEYMHEMGVAHRDLKPENLLLTTHGALKITDFGNGECFRMAWETEAHLTAGLCGSAPYIAPEEYTDPEFDPRAVDVWATGVIYMAMRTGRHLWRVAKKDEDEFFEKYLEGRKDEEGYAPIETLKRARCKNVIYSILDPNPKRRITASQVLKSEWGKDIMVCKAGQEGY